MKNHFYNFKHTYVQILIEHTYAPKLNICFIHYNFNRAISFNHFYHLVHRYRCTDFEHTYASFSKSKIDPYYMTHEPSSKCTRSQEQSNTCRGWMGRWAELRSCERRIKSFNRSQRGKGWRWRATALGEDGGGTGDGRPAAALD